MSFYDSYILPKMIHFTCSMKSSMRQREKVIPMAKGQILEIGFGSGLNLPFYDPDKVNHIWGLDPSLDMWAIARENMQDFSIDFEFLQASAEKIPLDSSSVDTIVVTYTLCTIPDVPSALQDMRRVLKPGGELIFCEHGKAPDEKVQRWQNRLNPIWKKLGGGCNLNRKIPSLLEEAGFNIQDLNTMYIPGWKPACFNYWGIAT